MRKFSALVLPFLLAFAFSACQDDYATKMCLSAEGTHQDCGISCSISESKEACAKWETMTKELCDKVGKEKCEEICKADENKYACEKAKTM